MDQLVEAWKKREEEYAPNLANPSQFPMSPQANRHTLSHIVCRRQSSEKLQFLQALFKDVDSVPTAYNIISHGRASHPFCLLPMR